MRLVQYRDAKDARRVGIVAADGTIAGLDGVATVYALAMAAIADGEGLEAAARRRAGADRARLAALEADGRLLAPFDHPDPAHLFVTGTGLTHLGSADARDRMHAAGAQAALTDSMKMFKAGLEGGRPPAGEAGVQPEWFYKGNGDSIVAPGAALVMPAFAEDGGEEPEIAGLYVVDPAGSPRRVGFAIGNEFSDHVTERRNYLLLAHSKLRGCAFGPELLLGPLPADIRGTSRIIRAGKTLWEQEFLSGEANMSHTVANLEHHHFKYALFRRPGDAHVHFFGTATLSYAAGVRTEPGDVFEVAASAFGSPLRNPLARAADEGFQAVAAL